MTSYLFVSNTQKFKIDNIVISEINHFLDKIKSKEFFLNEIKKNQFYEWKFKETNLDLKFKFDIKQLLNKYPIDVNFLKNEFSRKKKILFCDMDSTIIRGESLDEIASEAGIDKEVVDITKRAMRGEIDFHESLKKRIKLLRGFPLKNILELNKNIIFENGSRELISLMKKNNCLTILVSGGFSPVVSYVARNIGFDFYHCNYFLYEKIKKKLVIKGSIVNPILGSDSKLTIARNYVKKLNLNLNEVVSVGDGANDLDLIKNSGLGVSFKGKEILNEIADITFNYTDLKGIAYIQGYKDI